MKRFPKSILRACCAIAGGVVLVQYREQAVMWITVGIGIVFFISAVISFIDYLALRKNSEEQVELYDAQGRKLGQHRQRRFPVVAVGCGISGLWHIGQRDGTQPGHFRRWTDVCFSSSADCRRCLSAVQPLTGYPLCPCRLSMVGVACSHIVGGHCGTC